MQRWSLAVSCVKITRYLPSVCVSWPRKSGKVSLLSVCADDSLIKLHGKRAVAPDDLPAGMAAVVEAAAQIDVAVPVELESVEVCETSKAIAESLLAGEKRGFPWQCRRAKRAGRNTHALAVELAKLAGARVGFIGEAANSLGGYVAKALPTALNAYEMFAQPRKAYVLLGLEPELDCHNPQLAVAALKQVAWWSY